jgi:hypothetical protein
MSNESFSKTSFVSHIKEADKEIKKPLTEEEIQNNLISQNKTSFSILNLICLISGFTYLYLVAQKQNLYFIECAQCKFSFFSNFYFYFVNNFGLVMLYMKNSNVDIFKESKDIPIYVFHSFFNILIIFGGQMFFSIAFFVFQNYFCSIALQNILINLFFFQIIQYTLNFFFLSLYYIKTYREIETIYEKKAEVVNTQVVEIFNASFALNETKSEFHDYQNKFNNRVYINDNLNTTNNNNQTKYSNTTNISNFNMTNSTIDNSKFISTISENSIFGKSFMRNGGIFRPSPRKRINHIRDLK